MFTIEEHKVLKAQGDVILRRLREFLSNCSESETLTASVCYYGQQCSLRNSFSLEVGSDFGDTNVSKCSERFAFAEQDPTKYGHRIFFSFKGFHGQRKAKEKGSKSQESSPTYRIEHGPTFYNQASS